MANLIMPKLGLTMEEGAIAQWHKRPGEAFREGEPLFAVETDKATLDVEAEGNGVLTEILIPEGGHAPVGAPIARIEIAGARAAESAVTTVADTEKTALPRAQPAPVNRSISEAPIRRLRASPVARRRARELGIDLNAIRPSGPGGRVILRDLVRYPQSPASGEIAREESELPGRTISLSPMRRAIAAAMQQAAAVPQFRVVRAVDLTRTLALHASLKADFARAGAEISISDFLIQACAIGLAAHREINASYIENRDGTGSIRMHNAVNIGLAIAVAEGLVVPVLRDADRMTLLATAALRQELTQAARAGRLTASQMTGATFTLSNLGPAGADQFDAIVTPPQAAVLAAGRVALRPIAFDDGRIEARPMITLTLTSDHRVLDGAMAAAFLRTAATILEEASAFRSMR